jgi:hypothetical protein
MLARLQFWLQGRPNKYRPWWVARIGNAISDLRYWAWRARGGSDYTYEKADMLDDLLGEHWDTTASTNTPTHWTFTTGATTSDKDIA